MEYKRRQALWQSRILGVFIILFTAGLIISLALSISAAAATATFKITNAEITNISDNATGSIASYDDSTVVSNVTFHELNDSVTYKITLKNSDSEKHIIKDITDDNSNPYITFAYDNHANEAIAAGENLDFTFIAEYASSITDMSKRDQSLSVKFSIQLADDEEPVEIAVAPKTGDSISASFILLAASVIGLAVSIAIIIRRHKSSGKIIGAIVVAAAALTIAANVKAITTDTNSFTLTANYGLYDKLVVSYGANNETVEQIVPYGKPLENLMAIPTKNGYTNDGWKLESGDAFDPTSPIVKDTALTTTFSPISYKVHFDGNGANDGEMGDQSFIYDIAAKLTPNQFTRTNYDFTGWSTTADGQNADNYADKDEVKNLTASKDGTVTLYAQWKQRVLTINFDGNGLTFADGETTNTIAIASGCHEEPVPTTKISHTDKVNDDGTAGTTTDDYGVTYYDGYSLDQATKDVVTMTGASSLRVTINYSIEEGYDALYVFQGEYDGEVLLEDYQQFMDAGQIATISDVSYDDPLELFTTTLEIDGDTVTFAFVSDYAVTSYGYYATVVALDENGNVLGDGTTTTVCNDYVASGTYSDPALGSQREFVGWSETPTGAQIYADIDDILEDLPGELGETKTLYAVWRNIHTVTYDGNGATYGDSYSNEYYGGYSIYIDDNNFDRDGYSFIGWSTNKDTTTPDISPDDLFVLPDTNGETVFYAIWKKNHVITFNGNGSTSGYMYSYQVSAGDTITLPNNSFTRTNYDFIGWSEDENATTATYANKASFTAPDPAGTTELFAIWRAKPTVVFNGNGSTSGTMATQVFEFNTAAELTANSYSRTNYDFIGWSEDKNATTATYADKASFTPPTDRDETVLYAIWKTQFIVHFDGNGNTNSVTMDPQAFKRNTATNINSNKFRRTDYTFLGWSEDKNATTATYANYAQFTPPNDKDETTFYAIWEKFYFVHFNANTTEQYDGEMDDQSFIRAYTVSLRANAFTRRKYIVVGWSTDPNATEPEYEDGGQFTAPAGTEETTLYAVWKPAYTIVYDPNANDTEGEMDVYNTVKKVGDSTVLYAPNYSRSNYGFIGWSADTDAGARANNTTNKPTIYGPNQDIVLTQQLAAHADEERIITLYATWIEKDANYTFQTFNQAAFESANPSVKVTALEDTRDGDVYAIAKQLDGKWWMMENLRLNPASTSTTINATNTNNPTSTFLSRVSGVRGKTGLHIYYGCVQDSSNCHDQLSFNDNNINRNYPASPTGSAGATSGNINASTFPGYSWYSYGVAYNYYTATAGNGRFDTSGDAAGDLCSNGWHIPTGGQEKQIANSEYGLLDSRLRGFSVGTNIIGTYGNALNSRPYDRETSWKQYPINMALGGDSGMNKSGGNFFSSNRGSTSHVWASSQGGGMGTTPAFFETGGASSLGIYPGSSTQDNNIRGRAIRCMAN